MIEAFSVIVYKVRVEKENLNPYKLCTLWANGKCTYNSVNTSQTAAGDVLQSCYVIFCTVFCHVRLLYIILT